jgi:hypothetical protein
MKYQIHVTFMDRTWFVYDYSMLEVDKFKAALAEFTSRLHPGGDNPGDAGCDVKIFAVYMVKM